MSHTCKVQKLFTCNHTSVTTQLHRRKMYRYMPHAGFSKTKNYIISQNRKWGRWKCETWKCRTENSAFKL